MEVKDKLKPYLGTKTILIIDSEEDWKLLYQDIGKNWKMTHYHNDKNFCVNFFYDSCGSLSYFKTNYSSYNFIHSKDLLNTTRKYNLWKLKLTTS